MSSSLLMTRRFAPLFWCQFFSAFSDNFLKNALVFLILFHPEISGERGGALVTLAARTAANFLRGRQLLARELCNTAGMPPPLMLSRRFAPLFWCSFSRHSTIIFSKPRWSS